MFIKVNIQQFYFEGRAQNTAKRHLIVINMGQLHAYALMLISLILQSWLTIEKIEKINLQSNFISNYTLYRDVVISEAEGVQYFPGAFS